MSIDSFNALCAILRMRNGVSRNGARLVLVDGARPGDAAAMLGTTEQTVRNAVQRIRRGRTLVQECAQLLGV
jgi:transposase